MRSDWQLGSHSEPPGSASSQVGRKQNPGANKIEFHLPTKLPIYLFRSIHPSRSVFHFAIVQMVGRKYKYLGLYDSEVEAAVAYDAETVRRRGLEAQTNFALEEYAHILGEPCSWG